MQLDAIIVGAGIIGSSILHKLLSHPMSAVAFEAPDSSYASASTAAGAMLGAFGEITALQNAPMDEVETKFRVDCANRYENWIDSISSPTANRPKIRRGTFIIANAQGKDDINNINAIKHAAESFKAPHEWCDFQDISFLSPHQSMRPYKILHLPNEGYTDAISLLNYIKSASYKLSPNPFIREKIQNLLTDGDSVIGVQDANGRNYYSECVILCCGVNSLPLILKSAIPNHGVPTLLGGKGSSATISTDLHFPYVVRTPNRDFACGTHIVPKDDGSYYLGATNRISNTPGSNAGATSGEIHALLHSAIHEIHSDLRVSKIESLHSGIRPISANRYPVLGKTDYSGLFIATGTYRNGILMAPIVADIIHSEITESAPIKNPFSLSELKSIELPPLQKAIREGSRDLVSFIQEPHGSLPYNRSFELQAFIESILMEIVNHTNGENALREMANISSSTPLTSEIIPAIMYAAAKASQTQEDG